MTSKNPDTNNGHFELVNGKKFINSKNNIISELSDNNKYLGFSSEEEVTYFIIKSEKYFSDLIDGTIRYDDKKIFITTNGIHLNDKFKAKGYYAYNKSYISINAEYVYVKNKIVVRKVDGRYKFSGAFGKILFEIARKNRLNLLVYVKE